MLIVIADQSPAAALKRIQLQLPDEAERLLQGRVRIIKCANLALPRWIAFASVLCRAADLPFVVYGDR